VKTFAEVIDYAAELWGSVYYFALGIRCEILE
jgi:hypothetical protein